jgi:hypothetical protein
MHVRNSLAILSCLSLGLVPAIALEVKQTLEAALPAARDHLEYNHPMVTPRMETDLNHTWRSGDWTLKSGYRLELYPTTQSQHPQIQAKPLENAVFWQQKNWSAGLGFQIFAWGSADQLNPVDHLNPRDYTLGPDAPKIPVFASTLTWHPTPDVSLQGVWIPYNSPSVLPRNPADAITDAAFTRMRISALQLSQGELQTRLQRVPTERRVQPAALDFKPQSLAAGVRLQVRSAKGDYAFSYLNDHDDYPTARPVLQSNLALDAQTQIDPALTPMLGTMANPQWWHLQEVELYYQRLHRFGFDYRSVLGNFGVWAEAAYNWNPASHQQNFQHRNDLIEWVWGVDRFWGSTGEHYLNLQQVGRFVRNFDRRFGKDYPTGSPSQLDDPLALESFWLRALNNPLAAWSEGLLWGFAVRNEWSYANGHVKPIVEILYMIPHMYDRTQGKRYGDVASRLALLYTPTDGIELETGVQGYYSILKTPSGAWVNDDKNRLGLYYPGSRLYAKATIHWNL